MAYEFKSLGTVEKLSEVPENANAFIEVDGAIKRVSGGVLGGNAGGSGDWDAVIVDNSGALYYNGLSGMDVSSLQFAKGSLNDLYNMMMQGQSPKVCLCSLAQTSYGGPQYIQTTPLMINTTYYSAGQLILFTFLNYNAGSLSFFTIEGHVATNSFGGGEPA